MYKSIELFFNDVAIRNHIHIISTFELISYILYE